MEKPEERGVAVFGDFGRSDLKMHMELRAYTSEDFEGLMDLIATEGDGWSEYTLQEGRMKYQKLVEQGASYVAVEDGVICGYCRCTDDGGFAIYVMDLLVNGSHRGVGIGKSLLDFVVENHPSRDVYVLSDVDVYYEKLGYERQGSIYKVS